MPLRSNRKRGKIISNLIHRAYKDVETAKRNLEFDEECAFNYSYNAMLHCGLALMNSEEYRHKTTECSHPFSFMFFSTLFNSLSYGLLPA